jgi:hypothetical protein
VKNRSEIEMMEWDEEECVRSLTVRPSDKTERRQQCEAVQRTARLWAGMETGEMEVVLFLICFRLLPVGYGVWREYRPDRTSGVSRFLPADL